VFTQISLLEGLRGDTGQRPAASAEGLRCKRPVNGPCGPASPGRWGTKSWPWSPMLGRRWNEGSWLASPGLIGKGNWLALLGLR
jgi:hypothetical protein